MLVPSDNKVGYMVRKLRGVLVTLGVVYSGVVGALGLGELTLDSYLNEPFKANIELLNVGNLGDDQVRVQLASRADFQRAGVEREYILTSLSFETELNENGSGILWITTSQKVQEPYLNFIVEARWPTGRILREYTVLLDPPVFTENTPTIITETSAGNMRVPAPVQTAYEASVTATDAPQYQGGRDAADVIDGKTYRVRPDETLWAIAARAKPEGVSTQQAMLSIHKLNPSAFIGGNINQLKSGSVLRLPVQSELANESFAAAVAEVAEHHKRWQQSISGELATENEPGQQIDATPGDTDVIADSESDQGPTLKIATVDDGQGEGVEALQSEVVANLENLERAQRSNSDLQMRLDAMDEQINTLQRLLALKDEQISALSEAVQGRGTDFATADTLLAGELLDIEAEGAIESEPTDAVVVAEPEPTKPEPTTIASLPVVEPIVTEPSLMDRLLANIPYVGALLILLAAGIGYVIYRYRGERAAQTNDDASNNIKDEFAGVELGDEELIVDHFSNDAIQDTDSEARFSQGVTNYEAGASVGYAAQVETGDVLSEADIYIAYGRFPQAVDLLTEALLSDPANIEARIKLLEVDIAIGDDEAIKQDYANLKAIGDDIALARASALLDEAGNNNQWLENLPPCNLAKDELEAAIAGPGADAVEIPTDVQADSVDVTTTDIGSVDEEMLGIDLAIDEAPEADEGLLEEPLLGDSENLLADQVEPEASDSPTELELDIDDSLLDDIEDELGLELEIAADDIELDSPDIEEDGLEFDLSDAGDDDSGLELFADENEIDADVDPDLAFDELEMGDIVEDDSSELQLDIDDSDELGDFDFSDMDIESGDESELAEGLELPELDLPDVSDVPGFEDDGSQTLEGMPSSDNDEVNTKLDLARAYIDMGDAQGARDIIGEVLEEGSGEQLQQANKLLERLD